MYCVKCGVKLQDHVTECPLCGTPVWNPDGNGSDKDAVSSYPDKMPLKDRKSRRPILILLTALCGFVIVVETVICLLIYKNFAWSGYVTGGVLLAYLLFLLPFWFEHPKPEVFIPVDHVGIACLTYYVCMKTGGNWFFTFALPLLAGFCIVILTVYCLFKYIRGRRLFILSGACLFLGGFMILIEFLVSVTFGTKMFTWCWFPFAGLAAIGVFFLLIRLIRPLRAAVEKYFFF